MESEQLKTISIMIVALATAAIVSRIVKRERGARTFRRLRVPIPGTRGVPGGVGAVRGGGYNSAERARGGPEGETELPLQVQLLQKSTFRPCLFACKAP